MEEDIPLDRLLGKLTNHIRLGDDSGIIKSFCEATLEYYKRKENEHSGNGQSI